MRVSRSRLKREITADRMGAEIARRIGINRTYLYKKLHQTIGMSLDDLNKICKAYDRDATEFVDEIDLGDLEGLAA